MNSRGSVIYVFALDINFFKGYSPSVFSHGSITPVTRDLQFRFFDVPKFACKFITLCIKYLTHKRILLERFCHDLELYLKEKD